MLPFAFHYGYGGYGDSRAASLMQVKKWSGDVKLENKVFPSRLGHRNRSGGNDKGKSCDCGFWWGNLIIGHRFCATFFIIALIKVQETTLDDGRSAAVALSPKNLCISAVPSIESTAPESVLRRWKKCRDLTLLARSGKVMIM